MDYYQNETLWLNFLMSYAQIAAAIGTFLAIVLSLYLSRKDNRPKIKITSEISHANEKILEIKIVNNGGAKCPIILNLFCKTSKSNSIEISTIEKPANDNYLLSYGDFRIFKVSIPYLLTLISPNDSQITIFIKDHLDNIYIHRIIKKNILKEGE